MKFVVSEGVSYAIPVLSSVLGTDMSDNTLGSALVNA